MKIEQSAQNLNPFGGINFVVNTLRKNHIDEFIDTELGKRAPQAVYSNSDVVISFMLLQLCGGECAEDMNRHFRKYLQSTPDINIPSGDTILETFKSLKTPTHTFESKHVVRHQFNIHEDLNRTLIRLNKKIGLLREGEDYTYDYDNQVIPTEKYDAMRTYKKGDGYQPGVATIGAQIVYIENRNGNSQAKYLQHETLERSYKLLEEEGITIGRSRMDSASFQKEVIEVVKKYSKKFYIRAMRCDYMEERMHEVKEWKTITINYQKWEVASMDYAPFGGDETYRLVISRQPRTDKQGNLLTGDHYLYRGILTNDDETSEQEVIEFYNQRGGQEKVFDVMNNDFGWAKLPFSFMNENTVFLLVTAMSKSIYTWLVQLYSAKVDFVEAKGRLKKFIFHFITVCSKWVKRGRQYVLRLFTEKDFAPLLK